MSTFYKVYESLFWFFNQEENKATHVSPINCVLVFSAIMSNWEWHKHKKFMCTDNYIGSRMNLSNQTVKRAILHLCNVGLITKEVSPNGTRIITSINYEMFNEIESIYENTIGPH